MPTRLTRCRLNLCLLTTLLAIAGGPGVHAANLYWDGGTTDIVAAGDGASAGGSGTWDLTVMNWDPGSTSNHIAWPVGANANVANFGGTGGTVTFATNLGAGGSYPSSITISAGNYVFDQSGFDLSWRGAGLVVSSGATLALTNGTVTDASGGVSLTGANALKIYSKISGVWGGKGNAGDLYLFNDANDFTNTLYGQNGFGVYFTSIKDAGVPSAAGAGSVLQTGFNNTMVYIGPGDSANRTFSLIGAGNDTLRNNGTGALVWTGPFDNAKSAASTLTFDGTNTNNNEFGGNLTNSASGNLIVAKSLAGTWILSGINSHTGGTMLNAGKLVLGNASALGGGTFTITGGTLDSSVADLTNSQNNAQSWNGDFAFAGSQNLDLGTGAVTPSASRVVTISASKLTVRGGVGGGAIGLTKNGAGTLELAGTNTFTGTATVNAGTLVFSGMTTNLGNIFVNGGNGALVITDGATFYCTNGLNVGNAGTTNNRIIVAGAGTTMSLGLKTLNWSGNTNTFLVTGGAIVTNHAGNFGGGGGFGQTISVQDGGKLYLGAQIFLGQGSSGNRLLIGGSGGSSVVWMASGGIQAPQQSSLILNRGNGIIVSNGVLRVGSNGINAGRQNSSECFVQIYTNGLLDMNGTVLGIGDNTNSTANYLLVDGGVVTNAGSLSIGGGTAFCVANTGRVINGGALWCRGALTAGGSTGSQFNEFNIGGGSIASTVSNTTVTLGAPGAGFNSIVMSNAHWWSGNTVIGNTSSNNAITILADSGWHLNAGFINIGLVPGTGNVLTVAGGLITNVAGISVTPTNTLNLDGATLAAGANGNLVGGTGSAYIRSGGVTIDTLGFSPTNTLGLTEDPASTGGGLTKKGTGTLTLNSANTYRGPTFIDSGTLALSGEGAIDSSTNIVLQPATTLDVASRTNGTLALSAAQKLSGAGTVVGSVTNSGSISPGLSIGTLNVSGDYDQTGGSLNIELANGSNDMLSVGNSARLGGTLNVTLSGGYTPATNDVFVIMQSSAYSGGFASTNLPTLVAGEGWSIDQLGVVLVLSVTGAPSTSATGYDAWAGAITNGLINYNDSATGDGYPNLLKYATGSSPTNSDTLANMGASRAGGVLSLNFNRNTNATDVTLIVEGANSATNDTTWTGIATNIAGVWSPTNGVTETGSGSPASVSVQDNVANETNRFLRLRVTRP